MTSLINNLTAIVAVDNEWGIGNEGLLLARISHDMKNFRKMTEGKAVILGSKTLSTFPNGQPLKNRKNIIMSRNSQLKVEGAFVAHNIYETKKYIGNDEAVVIGGGQIYNIMLPYCQKIYVTRIRHSFIKDTFFPNLDKDPSFVLTGIIESFSSTENDSIEGLNCDLLVYTRIKK